MITALQNLISKGGKFVIIPLLLVIIVAFVLYLAQGTSFFDFFPDPSYEEEEFYGVDMNNPDQIRTLNIQNRVASDLGAIIPPLEDSMDKADEQFLQSLRGQLQAAFQSGQENLDQNAIQRLFGFIQSWPNLPKNFKAMEIARSGLYEPDFSQGSIRAMLVMDWIASAWGYLSDNDNHIGINNGFNRFVTDLVPSMNSDENRSKVLKFVGARHGISSSYVEYSLFRHFRANQVNGIFSDGGFVLNKEPELDLFSNRFAWKADILALDPTELNSTSPNLFSISFNEQPISDDWISISYGSDESKIIFVESLSENNASDLKVEIGKDSRSTLQNLQKTLSSNFDFEADIVEDKISIKPVATKLPSSYPQVSSSDSIDIISLLEKDLKSFYSDNISNPKFLDPARTFATMVNFPVKNYLSLPPVPEDSRMRTYFELNRDQFEPVPEAPEPKELINDGAPGPIGYSESNESLDLLSSLEGNKSSVQKVKYEDVKEEIRLRIIEEDRLDAERDAKELARDASLKFLDEVNSLRDRLKNKYSSFLEKRNSVELETLIAEFGGEKRQISFSNKEMGVQAAILGIERRESERKSNREPLEEVAALNETLFFTQSTRNTRDGYSVFLLDRKTEEKPSSYENVNFSDLYNEYSNKLRLNSFFAWADQITNELKGLDENETYNKHGKLVSINGKNRQLLESSYNRKSQLLRSRLENLENERVRLSTLERESNSTNFLNEEKLKIDSLIESLRIEQSEHDIKRALALQLVEACPNIHKSDGWTELVRTENEVVMARVTDVFTLIEQSLEQVEIENLGSEIETLRGEQCRDMVLKSLMSSKFIDVAKN